MKSFLMTIFTSTALIYAAMNAEQFGWLFFATSMLIIVRHFVYYCEVNDD